MDNLGERSIEGAVDVFIERLERLLAQGLDLASAKIGAMLVAILWLGKEEQRAEYEPKIREALAKRSAGLKTSAPPRDGPG
jgi:hypothetical protein